MKKLRILTTLSMIVLMGTVLLFRPLNSFGQKAEKATVSQPIPADLQSVFKKSCMGCHSDNGKGLAMGAVNFSKWDAYNAKKQAKKASAIGSMVSKEKMPPAGFLKKNPDAALTKEQVKAITDWAASYKK